MAIVRVGILGMGWVGSSVAISTLHSGVAQELLVHDTRAGIAEGEAMDLGHGAAFYPAATVRPAALDEMASTDVVVIAAGRGGTAAQTRLELLRDNLTIIRTLATSFSGYRGIVVMVTNPVDVLTRAFALASGLPHSRVLGTGTMLDTARLRQIVGSRIGVDARSVHAHVIGEHGDSEVALWSSAHVGGVPLRRWTDWTPAVEDAIGRDVRTAAYEIIRRKGATNHAIGLVSAMLIRTIVRGENRLLTVSRIQDGAFGLTDVALSLPAIVGRDGATRVIEPEMDGDEREGLERSAEVLRRASAET